MTQIQARKILVARHKFLKISLRARELNEFGVVLGFLIDVAQQAKPKVFGSTDGEWNRAWRDDRNLHLSPKGLVLPRLSTTSGLAKGCLLPHHRRFWPLAASATTDRSTPPGTSIPAFRATGRAGRWSANRDRQLATVAAQPLQLTGENQDPGLTGADVERTSRSRW
jgi:hypothetical protein